MARIDNTFRETIKIQNELGLHVRAAAKFIAAVADYDADITILRGEVKANGKSIMQVMGLAAKYGTELEIITTGAEARQCLAAAVKIINDKFGEN